jgi:ActR/RegA family two-component response regulator
MSLESLFVSRDTDLVRVLQPAFERFSVAVEVCVGPHAGTEILATEHFDAVIVDCDDLQGALDVLRGVRKTAANKSSVSLAVLHGRTTTAQAFDMGANFVLQKPVSALNALRCAHAAVGMMARERRRYYRHPVQIPVTAIFSNGDQAKITATNVSEGGMALRFEKPLPQETLSTVAFLLPGMRAEMELRSDLAWTDERGKAGVKFLDLPKSAKQLLENWLLEQFTRNNPELANFAEEKPKSGKLQ